MSNRINYNSIPQNGLVLDMPLDGSANARVGSNGTATNVTWVDSEKGYTSKVGSFNGSSSSVLLSSGNGYTKVTISMYIKFTTLPPLDGTGQGLMGASSWSAGKFLFQAKTITGQNGGLTRIEFQEYNQSAGGTITYFTAPFIAGQIYHIIGTYDATTKTTEVFVDNVLHWRFVANNTTSLDINSTYIGNTFQALHFNGQIGLVKIYNRALSTEEIHNLKLEGDRLFGDKPNYPQLLRGLKAYYDFKGGSLSNLVDGTNATNNGATLTTDHLGIANNAYSFNGTSSEIVGTHTLGTGDITFSYAGYLYLSGTQTQIRGEFLAIGDLNLLNTGLTFSIRPKAGGNDAIYFDYAANAGGVTVARVNYGAWNYITVTKIGSTIVIGINGIEETFIKTLLNVTTNALRIGRYNSTVTNAWFNGKISFFQLFNRSLSIDEKKELYNLTSKEYIYPFSKSSLLSLQKGLVMHLDSNGVDLSGNGNNGTPTAVTPTRRGQSEGGIYNGSSSKIQGVGNNGIGRVNGQPITVSCRAKLNTYISYEHMVSLRDTLGFNFMMYVHATGKELSFHGSVQNRGTYVVPLNKTEMYTCTVDTSGLLSVYINGKLYQTIGGYTYSTRPTANLVIGADGVGTAETLNGNIYSPKIRNRALSPKEVEMEYYLNYIN